MEYFNVNLHYAQWALKASGGMGSVENGWEIAFGQQPDHLRDKRAMDGSKEEREGSSVE